MSDAISHSTVIVVLRDDSSCPRTTCHRLHAPSAPRVLLSTTCVVTPARDNKARKECHVDTAYIAFVFIKEASDLSMLVSSTLSWCYVPRVVQCVCLTSVESFRLCMAFLDFCCRSLSACWDSFLLNTRPRQVGTAGILRSTSFSRLPFRVLVALQLKP